MNFKVLPTLAKSVIRSTFLGLRVSLLGNNGLQQILGLLVFLRLRTKSIAY